jgi:hypothetical protein
MMLMSLPGREELMKKRRASILRSVLLKLALLCGLALPWLGFLGLEARLFQPPAARAPLTAQEESLRTAFAQAAFRAEYDSRGTNVLRRWASPIRVYADGSMTPGDGQALDGFISQLSHRVRGLPPVSRVADEDAANLVIRYAPLKDLPALDDNYVHGNWGFFTFWYDGAWQIYKARVLVATDVTSQRERNHLLMEELTGALGLANDLDDQPDSILYQAWTATQQLSGLDWQLLNLLYDARLRPGMSLRQAMRALEWQ